MATADYMHSNENNCKQKQKHVTRYMSVLRLNKNTFQNYKGYTAGGIAEILRPKSKFILLSKSH